MTMQDLKNNNASSLFVIPYLIRNPENNKALLLLDSGSEAGMTGKEAQVSSAPSRGFIKLCIFTTFICTILMVSTVALADDTTTETCANGVGKVVYGVVDNEKYCVFQSGTLDYWNTYAWCDAQKMTLPDITRDCRCSEVMSDCSAGYCPNFGSRFGEGYMWFANMGDSFKAYNAQISASIGRPRLGLKERSSNYRQVVVCKI